MIVVIASEIRSMDVDMDGRGSVPVPAHTAQAAAATPLPTKPDNSPQRMAGIAARPLFNQNRRPAAGAGVVAGLPKLPRLTGVVVSPVGGLAIFASSDGGPSIVVGEGARIGAAVIETVAVGQVTIRGPDGVVVLRPAFNDMAVQMTELDPVDLAIPGYRPRQDGHYAAFWKTIAAAGHPGADR